MSNDNVSELTGIATSATPDNERNYGMEDGGEEVAQYFGGGTPNLT